LNNLCAIEPRVEEHYERAFSGDEFASVMALFERAGVQMWLPEAGGRWVREDPMARVGHGARCAVAAGGAAVAASGAGGDAGAGPGAGRYLGGRPPYGYRLVDAGPRPNRAHARWGRRLQRLEPDPGTGPNVQWMFAQRLVGRSIAGIARGLTERGVPCPSGVGLQRNRHRDGGAWTLRTVAVILSNPRYTGRQVWGRQQQAARRSGGPSHQSMSAGEWAVSVRPAHPALVSETGFVAAQHVRAARQTRDGRVRSYLKTCSCASWLAGLPIDPRCPRWTKSGEATWRVRWPRSGQRDCWSCTTAEAGT
jgi:hypothetical protein